MNKKTDVLVQKIMGWIILAGSAILTYFIMHKWGLWEWCKTGLGI